MVFCEGITYLVNNPTRPSLARWAIWFSGLFEAAGITFLRARFHWFPLHPIGLIFQQTHAAWWYWINFFIAWVLELILLLYGGVKAYLAGNPFFYGWESPAPSGRNYPAWWTWSGFPAEVTVCTGGKGGKGRFPAARPPQQSALSSALSE